MKIRKIEMITVTGNEIEFRKRVFAAIQEQEAKGYLVEIQYSIAKTDYGVTYSAMLIIKGDEITYGLDYTSIE